MWLLPSLEPLISSTNKFPIRYFLLSSSILSIYHKSTINIQIPTWCALYSQGVIFIPLSPLKPWLSLESIHPFICNWAIEYASKVTLLPLYHWLHIMCPKWHFLVYDLGEPEGLPSFKSESIDFVECSIHLWDISSVNKFIGLGTAIQKFI